MRNLRANNGIIRPELVGIKRASTFSGFCELHDREVFSPVENKNFEGTAEQCFLLGYRATARELYTKIAAASLSEFRRSADAGRKPEQQFQIQMTNFLVDIGNTAGLRDSRALKEKYDEILMSKSFQDSVGYVVELDRPPSVMCSGGWFPAEDFQGNQIQDLGALDEEMNAITCTSYWGGETGVIVFQWLRAHHDICARYIKSFHALKDDALGMALLDLFFDQMENLQLSPAWWEGLSEVERNILVDRMASSANPFEDMKTMAEKGKTGIDPGWQVRNRYTVGFDFNEQEG